MLGPSADLCPVEFSDVFSDWMYCAFEDESADAARTCELAASHQVKKLVLDDYRIHDDYQQILKKHGFHWLQFDGAGQKNIYSDWVVNAMPGTTADLYTDKLKTPATRLLLGPHYAVLRPEFSVPTAEKNTVQKTPKVFVFAGGGDDKQVLTLLLASLLSMGEALTLCVVTTSNNPGLTDVANWIHQNGNGNVELHIDAGDMPALLRSCSMAVASAGTVTYEINCTGLPMVLFSMADNQIAQAQAWAASTGARYLGDYRQLAVAAIQSAVSESLKKTDQPVTRLVDGQGARRIVQEMMALKI
jgi:spore coat polysaccharide biosynthesis predicted glycosyltransferase SpsG